VEPFELTVKAEEGSGTDVYRWLATDPDTRGFGPGAVPAGHEDADGDGLMGTGFDLLNLLIPNALALGSLFTSLAAFRDQRRRGTGSAPAITVEAGAAIVVVTDSADPQALAEQLRRALPAAQAASAAAAADPEQGSDAG
jgi:hypothetical protein